jgi:hypothetical protein
MILKNISKIALDRFFLSIFLLLFVAQILFWQRYEDVKPKFNLIDKPPDKNFIKAISLGDDEFLFRILALRLQNSGDVFAGFAPLKNYNYHNMHQWMNMLDSLNHKSNVTPHLATYYYSNTQNKKDLIYIIDYLEMHSDLDFDNKWLWLTQAALLANDDYKDSKKALFLAEKLANKSSDKMPIWTKQLPAFIYANIGESCMAFTIIKNLMDDHDNNVRKISKEEMEFMRNFIRIRLNKLKSTKFNPTKCPNYKKK